ncbi:hypothetical protein [Actinacidiphila glaucinigra]|uniref:hypothetical protein n=1 Tax=Actinacidiphila glaucinigra TaxID=235986 RepID=UPI0036E09DDA
MTSEAAVATSTHHIGVPDRGRDGGRGTLRHASRRPPGHRARDRSLASDPDGNDIAAVPMEVAP